MTTWTFATDHDHVVEVLVRLAQRSALVAAVQGLHSLKSFELPFCSLCSLRWELTPESVCSPVHKPSLDGIGCFVPSGVMVCQKTVDSYLPTHSQHVTSDGRVASTPGDIRGRYLQLPTIDVEASMESVRVRALQTEFQAPMPEQFAHNVASGQARVVRIPMNTAGEMSLVAGAQKLVKAAASVHIPRWFLNPKVGIVCRILRPKSKMRPMLKVALWFVNYDHPPTIRACGRVEAERSLKFTTARGLAR